MRSHMQWLRGTILQLVLFIGAAFSGVLAEQLRIRTKGSSYATSSWNDYFYYRAMVSHLWSTPVSLFREIVSLKIRTSMKALPGQYSSALSMTYLHTQDGLAHQPPYVYRILQPSLVSILHHFGLSIDAGFLVLYCLGLGLIALCAYGVISSSWEWSWMGAVSSCSIVLAALATSSPGYPDTLFLGLSMMAIWAAVSRKGIVFVVASALAVLTRETGVILAVFWVLTTWTNDSSKRFRRIMPASAPLFAFFLSRVLVSVPDSQVNYVGLLRTIVSPIMICVAISSIGLVALFSPTMVQISWSSTRQLVGWNDRLIVITAICYALISMCLASNTSRMALLVAPLFIGATNWGHLRSRLWIVGAGMTPIGYAICDTLAARANAPLGIWIWPAFVALFLSIQIVAVKRDAVVEIPLRRAAPPMGVL